MRTITCRQCSDEFEFIGPGARAFCDDHVRYETRRGKRRYNAGTSWRYSLKYKFGLTLEQWDALLIAQSGRCAICGCTPKADASFAVDHDHACCPGDRKTCGKCVRGLLCMKCNVAIGHMSDDPTRLRAAASYLETHSNAPSGAGEVHT